MRGSRGKNIVRELNNEKVDIIRWSDNMSDLVEEALKPAGISNIALDETTKTATITVPEDQLSLAIGKRGQNARLSAKLTGWEINIQKDESAKEIFDARIAQAANALVKELSIDQTTAEALVRAGMESAEVIVLAEPQDLVDAAGIDIDAATAIFESAKKTQSED